MATAAVVGSAIIGKKTAEDAADKQVEGIANASRVSAAAAKQARGDIIKSFGSAYQDFTTNIDRGLDAIVSGTQPTINILEGARTGAIGELRPFADVGSQALQQQAALSGVLGEEAEQQAIDQLTESPGQKFLRERQEQALLRNQAAIGGLGGGNVRTALQEQAFGIASQQKQQRLQNLGALTGLGAQATQDISRLTSGTGTDIASIIQQDAINRANLLERRGQGLAGISQGEGTSLANIATGQGVQQAGLAQSKGSALAAGALGEGRAIQQGISGVLNLAAMGATAGMGGMGGMGGGIMSTPALSSPVPQPNLQTPNFSGARF